MESSSPITGSIVHINALGEEFLDGVYVPSRGFRQQSNSQSKILLLDRCPVGFFERV
jgi:hypothetical protein